MSAHYTPPLPDPWTGRPSAEQAYIHEVVRPVAIDALSGEDIKAETTCILGYACDEGVRRNLGRPGAAKGPQAFRQKLAKLPWHLGTRPLLDTGTWSPVEADLEGCQEAFSHSVTRILETGGFPLGIGGGHDMAFAHYRGIRDFLPKGSHLGILNFDAHLDLRQPKPGPHSGSPFFQIAKDCETRGEMFQYGCMGVRADANPPELFRRAADWGVWLLDRDALAARRPSNAMEALQAFMAASDQLYLSIDLDGFSSAYAPGVSAASPLGFSPAEVFPLLDAILKSGKLIAADLAELNPDFDRDGQTAQLAAGLAHRILHMRSTG